MNVRELINCLNALDPNCPVVLQSHFGGWYEVRAAGEIEVAWGGHPSGHGTGEHADADDPIRDKSAEIKKAVGLE